MDFFDDYFVSNQTILYTNSVKILQYILLNYSTSKLHYTTITARPSGATSMPYPMAVEYGCPKNLSPLCVATVEEL